MIKKRLAIAKKSKSKGIAKKSRGRLPKAVPQPPKSRIKKRAWDAFSKFVRTRDCLRTTNTLERGKCITCGCEFSFKDLQAGHFVAGRHNGNLFSEQGTHAQCRACNIFGHGKPLEYRRAIIALYGAGYDETLESEAREIRKYSVEQLTNLAEWYKLAREKLEEASK